MRDNIHDARSLGLSIMLLLVAFLWGGWAMPAHASEWRLPPTLCHAVSSGIATEAAAPAHFSCAGTPTGYQHGSLWYRVDLARQPVDRADLALMVHDSRFDRLMVTFFYADGSQNRQQVRSGDFGTHWRIGGQIAFVPPQRDAPLIAMTLRFDRLASAQLLRMRLLNQGEGNLQSTALAASIGASLTLLLIGALYNFSLAIAVRRTFPAWQGAWAGCMVAWGTIWSQFHLALFPGMAGALSAQICTALSCLAVALATLSAITALSPQQLPRPARFVTLAIALLVGLLGLPLALMRSGPIEQIATLLGLLILADLLAVAVCIGWAWKRGSAEARAFAGAWAVPMATLAAVQLIDIDHFLWGCGPQLLVLSAAAWQTLWLSIAATHRFAHLRIERDKARTAEAQAHEMARRDPLTGLRNRRGFLETIAPMMERARTGRSPVALLILDVDLFKSINDGFGHEAGDRVLTIIGERLNRWDGPICTVARFGGEEFAVMVEGLKGFALAQFGESVRQAIAACDYRTACPGRSVTVSIGGGESSLDADFRSLYRLADEALYEAKEQGRDRVVIHDLTETLENPDRKAWVV